MKLSKWHPQAVVILVVEFKGWIRVRVRNEADVGELGGDPLGLVLHAEVDQLTQRVELVLPAEPDLLVVGFHIIVHIFVDLWLRRSSVEVFQL